ncbi:MAG: SusE domain-containing protein, partial [Chitinophagaceae bacterium]|nr:SusE domain-containing protein [Chitinophagaceae bacterium]
MRAIKSLFVLLIGIASMVAACTKVDELPFYESGAPVTLTASKTDVAPTIADSNSNVVSFIWSDPNYSTDTSNYKFLLEIDSTGRNFAKKTVKEISGDLGTGFTGREINAILLNNGFSLGVPITMDVRVVSSYANNNERYESNVVTVKFTPYSDPSKLTSNQISVEPALATAGQNALTFSWTPSFPGYSGTINYMIQYDSAGKNFANPKDIAVGSQLYSKGITQGEINETALSSGVPGGNTGKIDYRVKATTAQGAISYSNLFSVMIKSYVPILRFYLPGDYQAATGNGANWDPPTAPELIRDLRPAVLNKLYYTYIYLPAGAKFKVTQGRSWDVNYGGTAGTLVANGPEFTVATAGVYRVSIDRTTMKYDIRNGRMGFVGGGTGAGWTPPNVFPAFAMGAPADNLFIGVTDLTVDAWKLIDNNEWNNGSNAVDETRSYGTGSPSGSTLEINGP